LIHDLWRGTIVAELEGTVMRHAIVLILLGPIALIAAAADQPAKKPRLDAHGDPLPDGASARLGSVRFQLVGNEGSGGRFLSLRYRWRHEPTVIALSQDGTTVASIGRDIKEGVRVYFLDTATGKTVRHIDVAENPGERVQFAPDGKSLVFSSWFGIKFVDAQSGKITRSIDIENSRKGAAAVSADGKWMAAQPQKYVYDAPVGIWDIQTGKEVVSLPGRGAACNGLVFSPDKKRLLLSSTVPTKVDDNSMGFGSDSKVAVACIDIATRKIVGEIPRASAQHVALGPDGETVALEETADRKSIRILHLPTVTERSVIPVKGAIFEFAPNGKMLVTIDGGGQGALWDAKTGEKIRDLEGPLANKDFQILGIGKDGAVVVLDGGWQSAPTVVVWNASTGKRVNRPPGHDGTVTCLAYAPDGKVLASGSLDKTVRLWNPATGEHLRVLTVHQEAIAAVSISPDSKLVASSSQAGVIRLSQMADGKTVGEFVGPAKGATRLAFAHDSTILFAGGETPEVLAWEIASAKEVVRLRTGPDGAVKAFGDGGNLVVTANGEIRSEEAKERLQIWRPTSKLPAVVIPLGVPLREFRGRIHCDAAIFSADARLLASSQISEYQGIRPSYGAAQLCLWERASGQPIRTLAPTITQVLAFSANGRLLASGGTGHSGHLSVGYGEGIDIWDTLTGKKVGALPVTPQCVAFSPDGLSLAAAGWDHSVLIWPAPKLPAPMNAKAPSAEEREAWWTALGGEAKDAYATMGSLLEAPEHAMALLKERVRPDRTGDPEVVAKLIAQLDSKSFAEREEARKALEKLGEGAAHLLAKALEGKVSMELSRRLEELLRKCEATSSRSLQQHRCVAVLEWIGTPDARALLRTLAEGAPRARLTAEARAALNRIKD
jgi:WD40 repeat protein